MKDWATDFYKSHAWRNTRKAYADAAHGICEWCGDLGEIVHHNPPLTPQTIHNKEHTLGWNHLILLCRSCHGKAHSGITSTTTGTHFNEFGDLVRD